MKPWRTWLARLGGLGALAIVIGCGGGDVPDPGSDGQMAALPESNGPAQPVAPAPAPAASVAADEGKAEEAKADEATAQAPAPAPAREPAGAGGGERRTRPRFGDGRDAGPGDQGATGSAPGGRRCRSWWRPRPGPGGPGGARRPRWPRWRPWRHGHGHGHGHEHAGQQQQQQQQQMQRMQAQMKNQMAMQPGGPGGPGMMGGPGGPGGPGGNDKAPDFRRPEGAVEAFMSALKAKDLNRLTDATALRAGTDADTAKRNHDMFRRIKEGTLSDSELNDLAALLEGYKVSGFNQARSSGKLGVILSKRSTTGSRSNWSIVITVRREKKGWGVCDISRPAELKNPGFGPPARQSKRT